MGTLEFTDGSEVIQMFSSGGNCDIPTEDYDCPPCLLGLDKTEH